MLSIIGLLIKNYTGPYLKAINIIFSSDELKHNTTITIQKPSNIRFCYRRNYCHKLTFPRHYPLNSSENLVRFHRYESALFYHISVIERNVIYVLNPARVPL